MNDKHTIKIIRIFVIPCAFVSFYRTSCSNDDCLKASRALICHGFACGQNQVILIMARYDKTGYFMTFWSNGVRY